MLLRILISKDYRLHYGECKTKIFLIIFEISLQNTKIITTFAENHIIMDEKRNIKQKINLFIGSIGAFIGVAVFVAYIPQIMANLEGHKAQPWQPLFAAGSCLIWVVYGWTKEPKPDYILIIPNLVGVVLGFLTFITSL